MTDTHAVTVLHAPIEAPQRSHPLVDAAMRNGAALADPATLRELLSVQRDWEAGEARKAYTRALAALKRDLPTVVERDATVDYTIAKAPAVHKPLASIQTQTTQRASDAASQSAGAKLGGPAAPQGG
jgi:hypothetical protein